MPINWKSKIILAKTEGVYGVSSVPSGLLNAMLMTDVQLQPMEGEEVSRNLEQGFLGPQEELPTGIRVVLTGSVELVGSGSPGVAPAWGPLLRACAVGEIVTANTSVEYVPVSEGHESLTLNFWIGPSAHDIRGVRGTAVVSLNAQGIPTARFTLTGLFTLPIDAGRPLIDLTKFQVPQVATKANTPGLTINGVPFILRSFTLDLANDVQSRLLVGYEGIQIVDRNELVSATIEAVPYATYNPFQKALTSAPQELALLHGTVAGRRVRLDVQRAVQRRPAGLEQNQNVVEWPLTFRPLPSSAGNDQWKLTLT